MWKHRFRRLVKKPLPKKKASGSRNFYKKAYLRFGFNRNYGIFEQGCIVKLIDFRDAMVAGVVVVNDLTLVSRNKTHFGRVKEMKLQTW